MPMPQAVRSMEHPNGRVHVDVECAKQAWHVTIKPAKDMNGRVVGAYWWIRKGHMPQDTPGEALQAAMAAIARLSQA